jgi:Peptidase family M28/PDZ domain/PA domain
MRTKIRSLQSFLLALALTATTLAQQPSAKQPSPERLRQVIEYLASDTLEGRRTGTPGANGAAHYIAGEFSLLGLRTGMQAARAARTRGETRSRYLQSFPYIADVQLGKNNSLRITRQGVTDTDAGTLTITLAVGNDWIPLGFATNAIIENSEIAFAGYGISSPALKYDDYSVSPAVGRVAVVFSGTPDGDNPHGQFVQAGEIRFKAAAARAAGARALVIITNEKSLADDRLARLSYDNTGEAGLPVILVTRKTGASLLGSSGEDLSVYEKMADARGGATGDGQQTRIVRLPVGGVTVSLKTDVVRRESPSFNVIGILPGSDPKLKDEAIVIGAHYDHLGLGGEGSLAPREGEIHHGADDNASGVAGLLELARLLSAQRPRRTIVFIAFSGEEEGLIGSNYYVNHPVIPLANTVAMINLDMIGRLNENKLIIGGVGTAQEWRDSLQNNNIARGLSANSVFDTSTRNGAHVEATGFSLTLNEDGFGPSDHSSFYAKQVPVLFFWTGTHNDYHKPSDTAEKINYGGEARIVAFIANIVRDIDKNDKRPTYTVAKSASPGRSTGFRVYLGTIPNYAESNDGLKIDGVRDDSPAAKAGLKANDKIVKIAGRDVKNVYDYTYALGEMKAGQEYEIEVVRGSERLKLKITPEARK